MKNTIMILLMILGTNLVADNSAKVDVFGYINSIVNLEKKSKISPILRGQKNNLLQIKDVGATDLDSLSYTLAFNVDILAVDYNLNDPKDQLEFVNDIDQVAEDLTIEDFCTFKENKKYFQNGLKVYISSEVDKPVYVTKYNKNMTFIDTFIIDYSTCVENGYFN